MTRSDFREACVQRDGGECIVPSCDSTVTAEPAEAGEVHHIIERKLWEGGGYILKNGASVCNDHHRLAERNVIPPQAFWRWLGIEDPPLPQGIDNTSVNKWGEPLGEPPWKEHRERIKYPSTRHLPWSHERDDDDTAHEQLEWLLDIPLIVTVKMDGGNAMIVKDTENPIRARNGQHADKEHFDMAKQWYWENNLYEKIPEHLQIFGEWLYAKHSIHYGCDCGNECEDVGPALQDYFQVFGMYDTRYDLWLSWYETTVTANRLDLTTVPYATNVYGELVFEQSHEAWDLLYELSQRTVDEGHEGVVVRSAHPFHYDQIDQRLGKYVRPGHVEDDAKHWSKRPLMQNRTI